MKSLRRLLAGLPFVATLAAATVHYSLTPQPSAKTILVSVTLDSPRSSEIFRIPGWCPGYYQMADYQKKMFDVRAADANGRVLPITKVDSRSWKVSTGSNPGATFSYRVLGDDPGLGFFAVNVAGDKAFVNGAAGFVYVDGRKTEDVDLTVKDPDGWDIATAMDPAGDSKYKAGGYDEFIDHPLQLGKFTRKTFQVSGIPFEAIFVAPNNRPNCDMDAEADRLRILSEPALKMFGHASFKRYLYILHLEVGNFNGGLEHRACNVQAVANTDALHLDDLATHEYFHAWNVKQIRPKILGPFDYTQPQRTGNLWFAEGVTDYYAKLHTYQSGIQSEGWLKAQLLEQIQELQKSHDRKTKTAEDASRECWNADGFGSGDLSFYTKGLLAGFIFDAAIIDATEGKKTLDDVMRLLYAKYALPKPGYGEDDLRIAINEVAGKDLSDLYDRMIRSTQEMPYGIVSKIGLRVSAGAATQVQSPDRLVNTGAGKEYELEVDPSATARARNLYQVWLHRLNGVD